MYKSDIWKTSRAKQNGHVIKYAHDIYYNIDNTYIDYMS